LFATDIDKETLIKYLDRFLIFYIRTADKLERTATWFNKLEGGLTYLQQVIIEDSLGICDELEAQMQHLVDTYECEWKKAINDPDKLKRFHHFVNTDRPDPSLNYVQERGQKRPALSN
jgi:nitrite reductase (NADH) large subunit